MLSPDQFESTPEYQRDPRYVGKHRKPEERMNGKGPTVRQSPKSRVSTQQRGIASHIIATHQAQWRGRN